LSRREVELVEEIVATADRILRARSPEGIPIVRRDPIALLVRPVDRRIVQVFLTRASRAELDAARSAEKIWAACLLLGLDEHTMATTTRVLRVIRQRLLRDERERGL